MEILPLDFKCHSFAWYGQYVNSTLVAPEWTDKKPNVEDKKDELAIVLRKVRPDQ